MTTNLVNKMMQAIYPEFYGPEARGIKITKRQKKKHQIRAERAIKAIEGDIWVKH